MPSKLSTLAACPRCGAILVRTPGVLVHPTAGERETIRTVLGNFWLHHAHTRFDGRFHHCPGRRRPGAEDGGSPPLERPPRPGTSPGGIPLSSLVAAAGLLFSATGAPAQAPAEFGGRRAPRPSRAWHAVRDLAMREGGESIVRLPAPSGPRGEGHAGDSPERAAAAWIGMELSGGRYQITERLAGGGPGNIYRAFDRNLDAEVTIEVPCAPAVDGKFAGRFAREVRRLALLSHPHLVKVTEVGECGGVPFLVSEHLPGGSLKYRRRVGPDGRPAPAAPVTLESWLPDVAAALDFLRAQGRTHRDVRPSNILFDAQGRAYLGGLGLSEAVAVAAVPARGRAASLAGLALGTPGYVAPELAVSPASDGKADQYALAAIVYERLGGRRPFECHTATTVLVEQLTREPKALNRVRPSIPEPLAAAVQRGLARDPLRRYPDCSTFARAVIAAAGVATRSEIHPTLTLPHTPGVRGGGWPPRAGERFLGRWAALLGVGFVAAAVVSFGRRARRHIVEPSGTQRSERIAEALRLLTPSDPGSLAIGNRARAFELPTLAGPRELATIDEEVAIGRHPGQGTRLSRVLAELAIRWGTRRGLTTTESASRDLEASPGPTIDDRLLLVFRGRTPSLSSSRCPRPSPRQGPQSRAG